MSQMHQNTLDVLRHVAVHGSRTRAEVVKAFTTIPAGQALSNLQMLGYLAGDGVSTPLNFIVTKKGHAKIAQMAGKDGVRTAPATPAPAPSPALTRPVLRKTGAPRPIPRIPSMGRASSGRQYLANDLAPSNRPGAMRAFELPSRMGDVLRYRDGRVTDLDGNPVVEA